MNGCNLKGADKYLYDAINGLGRSIFLTNVIVRESWSRNDSFYSAPVQQAVPIDSCRAFVLSQADIDYVTGFSQTVPESPFPTDGSIPIVDMGLGTVTLIKMAEEIIYKKGYTNT